MTSITLSDQRWDQSGLLRCHDILDPPICNWIGSIKRSIVTGIAKTVAFGTSCFVVANGPYHFFPDHKGITTEVQRAILNSMNRIAYSCTKTTIRSSQQFELNMT